MEIERACVIQFSSLFLDILKYFPIGLYILQYFLVCLLTDWHGVLFIRQGLYQEGVFKFSVQIPENYPDGDAPVS